MLDQVRALGELGSPLAGEANQIDRPSVYAAHVGAAAAIGIRPKLSRMVSPSGPATATNSRKPSSVANAMPVPWASTASSARVTSASAADTASEAAVTVVIASWNSATRASARSRSVVSTTTQPSAMRRPVRSSSPKKLASVRAGLARALVAAA